MKSPLESHWNVDLDQRDSLGLHMANSNWIASTAYGPLNFARNNPEHSSKSKPSKSKLEYKEIGKKIKRTEDPTY